jgi:hypothetical protein
MPTLATALRQELERLLEPLVSAAGSAERWPLVLALVGHTADAAGDPGLRAALDDLATLAELGDLSIETWDGIESVLAASARAVRALRELEHAASNPALGARLQQLGPELAEQLTVIYLRRYRTRMFRLAALLALVDPAEARGSNSAVFAGAVRVRTAWAGDELHLERLGPLLRDPWAALSAAYLPNDLAAAADAHAAAARLFPLLCAAAGSLGLLADAEQRPLLPAPPAGAGGEGDHFMAPEPPPDDIAPPAPDPDLGPYYRATQPRLVIRIPQLKPDGTLAGTFLGIAVAASSREHPGAVAGLIVELTGALNWTQTRGPWTLTASSQGNVPAFVVGPGGLDLASTGAAASAKLVAARQPATPGAPAFILGPATGTRIELGTLTAELGVALSAAARSAALTVAAASGRLVIAPSDGDGFLQYVLPTGGITVPFDAGVSLSSARGFEIAGGAGLEATLPAHVSLGSLGSINAVRLGLVAGESVRADVACAVTLRIGPVAVSVDGVGVRSALTFAGGGNLGVADLDIGFKPPTQLGLAVNGGPVTGGGALVHDPERGQYAGDVRLAFEAIAVRAVGLLTTRLPDGKPGFSLLVIVSAEFPPVQLGLGFRLVGVGGLLGINRTVAVEALRAGLKTGALGAVLSPPDPKASADQLVASLAGLFPPAAGRHVFAPTARIVWGSPTLITIDLCLVLELPSPVRLVALGRLRAVLPDERAAIVRLQIDVLGVIDFDRREAAVDATLVDSRLAQFALTGDMALRMNWGAQPTFLLAVGGFHPRFAAPPGFPALQRVAVALAGGDNPKLRLEAYLALTSNTVQFGARVDLAAKAGSFSIAGFLSFDALVTLAPLAFVVDIAAKLAVKMGGRTLLSVSLALTLSGPRPWRARGRASFSILFFDGSFGFDVTIGDEAPTALPTPVDVAPLLLAALADPRAWTAQLPAGAAAVTLRNLEPGTAVLAHPLGTLQVRQRLAPLERTLERFGTGVPSGAKRFRITLATIGGVRTTITPLQDHFAPAQFTALSDDAKLSAPSFEEMVSGAALGADGYASGPAVSVGVVYEQVLVTAPGIAEPKPQKLAMPADVFSALTATPPRRAGAFAVKDAA